MMDEVLVYFLYIHGFNSSPASKKACDFAAYCESRGMKSRLQIPELSFVPQQAMAALVEWVEDRVNTTNSTLVLIGSSLGGYYATYLAERFGLKAVLINPAVRPYELWQDHLGINTNYYSGKSYEITRQHIEQLRRFEVDKLSCPEDYLLLAQTGDETLDYRRAVEKYKQSPQIIQPGGSHSFDNFAAMLPGIFKFSAVEN